MRPGVALLSLVMLVGACSSATSADAASCSAPSEGLMTHPYRALPQEAVDAGAELNDVSLDVHASPTAHACPVVIWVHGGSWQAGDKRTAATDVKADHFVAAGYVFVSVNYRLASQDNEIRWPDFGDDVAAATAWVITNADDLGIDPGRVSLIGHSSGAHLVSIVATNPALLDQHQRSPADVACVISLDSVTHDLTDPPPWETDIIELAFPTPDALIDGSPTLQASEHAGGATPQLLIVTRGRQERIDSSERLAATVSAGGGTASVVDVSPYDHGEVSTMLGVVGEAVITPVVDEFLAGCAAAGVRAVER